VNLVGFPIVFILDIVVTLKQITVIV